MRLAFGLDLGTTSLSAAAVSDDGRLVARLNSPNPGPVASPAGHAEQDPLAIRTAALRLLRELSSTARGNPVCLGLTGQMHGGLLIDQRRRPLTRLITWQDRRANEKGPGASQSLLEEFRSRCDPADIERTGCNPSPGYLAVTLFALARQNAIPSDAHRATTIIDWLAGELCDVEPVTDRSNAASTGAYDLARDAWSEPLLKATGLDGSLFPRVVDSGTVMGVISPEIAAETGLASGLPVCSAIGDNQAAVLGSVPSGDPAIQINVGTGGQINWPVTSFVRLEGMDTRYLPQKRFMLVGAGLAGGDAFGWVKRLAAGWLGAFHATVDDAALYETINRLAAAVPADADGLVCEPLFRGTRRQPLARGSFTGITTENFTPGHIARAVLTGIARGLKWFYDHAGPSQPSHLKRIIGSGNGLRKNPLLVQTMADVFDREVWLAEHEEEAAYGAALLAGASTGLWRDLAMAGSSIRLRRGAAPGSASGGAPPRAV